MKKKISEYRLDVFKCGWLEAGCSWGVAEHKEWLLSKHGWMGCCSAEVLPDRGVTWGVCLGLAQQGQLCRFAARLEQAQQDGRHGWNSWLESWAEGGVAGRFWSRSWGVTELLLMLVMDAGFVCWCSALWWPAMKADPFVFCVLFQQWRPIMVCEKGIEFFPKTLILYQ